MYYFYNLYFQLIENRPHPKDNLKEVNLLNGVEDLTQKFPHNAEELLKEICSIPWFHQQRIIDKCKGDPQKALFYVRMTIENNWGRDLLLNFIKTDL